MPALILRGRQTTRWPVVIDQDHRLKNSADFRNIRKSGNVYKHPLVIVISSPNGICKTRIGIVAGKSTGGAVQRNLIKRRLRACIKEQLPNLADGWDIIVIARPNSGKAVYNDLRCAVFNLLEKAGVLFPADRQT